MDLKITIYQNSKQLFRRNGFKNTSLAQIIKESNCSKGGFYHYYKSKEDILPMILQEYEEAYIQSINAFIDPQQNGYQNLITFYKTVYLDNSTAANTRIELHDTIVKIDRRDLFREMRKKADGALIRLFCSLLEMGTNDGSIKLSAKPIVVAKLFEREFRYFNERVKKLIIRYDITDFKQALKLKKTELLIDEMKLSCKLLSATINKELNVDDIYIENFKTMIKYGMPNL